MPKPPRIHRVLSGKHIVWFGESNQWVAFEKPAYKVFMWLSKGLSIKKTSRKIAKKYNLGKKEAKTFVSEINGEMNKITSSTYVKDSPAEDKMLDKVNTTQKTNEKVKNFIYSYSINKHNLTIEYTHEKLAYYLHAPIKHFLIEESEANGLKLRLSHNKIGFSIYRDEVEIESCDTISELKHAFTKTLMQSIYEVDSKEWFAWIHASAVSDGKKAIIFSSASGSGKSTMAAVLQSQRFTFVSDDMIYMRTIDKLTYPVPGALSIKEGAIKPISKYIPDLNPDDLEIYEFGDRKIRFKPPEHTDKDIFKPIPVSSIVFINYEPKSDFRFKKLSDYEAFYRFHKEAWINSSKESALTFINWFEELSYYELQYSDTDKAIKQVEKLFQENS